MNTRRLLALILGCMALFTVFACSQVPPPPSGDTGTRLIPTSTAVAASTPNPETAIPPYLMPVLTPLRRLLHALNIAAIGGILVLYLVLLVALLSKRR